MTTNKSSEVCLWLYRSTGVASGDDEGRGSIENPCGASGCASVHPSVLRQTSKSLSPLGRKGETASVALWLKMAWKNPEELRDGLRSIISAEKRTGIVKMKIGK